MASFMNGDVNTFVKLGSTYKSSHLEHVEEALTVRKRALGLSYFSATIINCNIAHVNLFFLYCLSFILMNSSVENLWVVRGFRPIFSAPFVVFDFRTRKAKRNSALLSKYFFKIS